MQTLVDFVGQSQGHSEMDDARANTKARLDRRVHERAAACGPGAVPLGAGRPLQQ